MTIDIVLVDDHNIVREGISRVLGAEPDLRVVASFDNGRDAVRYVEAEQPDVAIVDISMPGLNGIETARRMHDTAPNTQIIILSGYVDAGYVHQALLAGAEGYVVKDAAATVLATAVRAVHAGRRYLCDEANTQAVREVLTSRGLDDPLGRLSAREREVLQLTVEGRTIAETARQLSLSPSSVETYRGRLMRKLEIENLPALVKFAIRHGVTSIE